MTAIFSTFFVADPNLDHYPVREVALGAARLHVQGGAAFFLDLDQGTVLDIKVARLISITERSLRTEPRDGCSR